jgi:hypothetical protein
MKNCICITLTLLIFIFGCQTFPPGENLTEIRREYGDTSFPALSTSDLYRYYAMCRAAWHPVDEWKESGWELDYVHNEETDTLGLLIPEGDTVYVVFRSSRALQQDSVDFYYNRRFSLRRVPFVPGTGIRAHRGFIEKYMSIRKQYLRELVNSGAKKIVLVGHSAGAAMVSLAFMDLKHLYPDTPLYAVTFGLVRVFNAKGARWYRPYRDSLIRIVNGRDFFPNLPPLLFGYRHIGRLVRIGYRPFWKIWSMYDHHPGYRRVLEAMLREEGIDPASLGY